MPTDRVGQFKRHWTTRGPHRNYQGSMLMILNSRGVQSFPASGGKWQVSTNGGAQPQWRRDGKELFYMSPDRKLMAVDVGREGSTFEAGVPKALFELRLQSVGLPGPRNFYSVTRDGKRFLVTSLLGEPSATPTTVVLNWTADLKR